MPTHHSPTQHSPTRHSPANHSRTHQTPRNHIPTHHSPGRHVPTQHTTRGGGVALQTKPELAALSALGQSTPYNPATMHM